MRNIDDCVSLGRGFIANGRSGFVSLKHEPGSRREVIEVENGTVIYITFTYNLNGEIWGVTDFYSPDKPPAGGWAVMNELLLAYDYISFEEDHRDELYSITGIYDPLQEVRDIVLWTWPGSGSISHIIQQGWRNTEHETNFLSNATTAYIDSEGREWAYVSYLYGRVNAWVCLDAPDNEDIQAFNPAPEPVRWLSDPEHQVPHSGSQLPIIAIILVGAVVIVTIVLILVFWKRRARP